jgi:hypothetical protein
MDVGPVVEPNTVVDPVGPPNAGVAEVALPLKGDGRPKVDVEAGVPVPKTVPVERPPNAEGGRDEFCLTACSNT